MQEIFYLLLTYEGVCVIFWGFSVAETRCQAGKQQIQPTGSLKSADVTRSFSKGKFLPSMTHLTQDHQISDETLYFSCRGIDTRCDTVRDYNTLALSSPELWSSFTQSLPYTPEVTDLHAVLFFADSTQRPSAAGWSHGLRGSVMPKFSASSELLSSKQSHNTSSSMNAASSIMNSSDIESHAITMATRISQIAEVAGHSTELSNTTGAESSQHPTKPRESALSTPYSVFNDSSGNYSGGSGLDSFIQSKTDTFHLSTPEIIGLSFGVAIVILGIAIPLICWIHKKWKHRMNKHYKEYWDDNVNLSYINGHLDTPKEQSEEVISLDNDSFLNSLDSASFTNLWSSDNSRRTNL